MKKMLARHKDKEVFDKIGFGIVTEDVDETKCKVKWLKSQYETLQLKNYIFFLDEKAENGYVE